MSNSGEKTPDKTNEPAKSVAKPAAKPAAKAKTVKAKAAAKNPPDTATAVKKAADKTTTAESAAPTKSAVAKSTASKNTVAKSTAAKNTGVKTTAAQAATAKAPVAKTTGAKTSVAESTVVKTAQIKAQTGGVKGDMVPAQPTNATPTPEKMTTPASVNTTPQRNSRETEPAVSNVLTPSADGEAQKPVTRHPVARREASDGRLAVYAQLMRLNRPIGILLLLWPTLWSLWLAAGGFPRWDLLVIFTLGVVLMRSAGCVINDYADRKIDGHVARTKTRPLATGSVSSREALTLFAVLCLLAFGLVLLTNTLTIQLSLGGLLLAFCYPFMKRHTHLPQVVLGAAFAWSIPMAFAAQRGALAQEMWLIYLAVVLWTVVYDTFYAMVDRDDDKRIGVKSTAILFGEQDRFITGFLQVLTLYALVLVGGRFELGNIYYASLVVAAGFFVYQQYLIRFRDRDRCFKAFLNNHWVGMVIFIGIVADLALKTPS